MIAQGAPSGSLRKPGIQVTLTAHQWRSVVAAACAAPSNHNSQPWRFVIRPESAELHLDPRRVLTVIDPGGREARISCGAALLNAQLAIHTLGVRSEVRILPHPQHSTLLATIRPVAARPATPAELELHRAIPMRHSHRHPFHSAPMPPPVLQRIVYAAAAEGGYLRMIHDPPTVRSVSDLVRRAAHQQSLDPRYLAELAAWTGGDDSRPDGVPETAGGPRPAVHNLLVMRDFTPDRPRPERDFGSDPLLAVLLSPGDTARDHLRIGQALQRALLTATTHGVGASIISAPIELPVTRAALRSLLGNGMAPQLVLRFGLATAVVTCPRRPVDEVVEWAS